MNKVLLDASALVALIKNERGAKEVEKLLGNIAMSSVNFCEVLGIVQDLEIAKDEDTGLVEPFINQMITFDQEIALLAASLKKLTKHEGLSLGDRACIATGIIHNLPIYTADKAWAKLDLSSSYDIKINLIR